MTILPFIFALCVVGMGCAFAAYLTKRFTDLQDDDYPYQDDIPLNPTYVRQMCQTIADSLLQGDTDVMEIVTSDVQRFGYEFTLITGIALDISEGNGVDSYYVKIKTNG